MHSTPERNVTTAINSVAVLLLVVLGSIEASYGYGLSAGPGWSVSSVACGLFTAGVSAAIYLMGKVYSIRWCELRGAGIFETLLESVVVPTLAVLIPIGFLFWARSAIPWLAAIGAIVLLSDVDKSVHKLLQEKAPIHDSESMAYLRFPPKDGIDMLPMDIIMIAIFVIGYFVFSN